jgi:hypothetical protein
MTGRGPVAGQTETRYATPFAVLGIVSDGKVITSLRYLPRSTTPLAPQDRLAERTCREIERYLADPDYLFTVPYRLDGTPFQCRVWREIEKLCPIKTITYGVMAPAQRPAGRGRRLRCQSDTADRALSSRAGGRWRAGWLHGRQGSVSIERQTLAVAA